MQPGKWGSTCAMAHARRMRLERLPGWRWGTSGKLGAKWEAQYLALQAFLTENGGRYPAKRATESTELCLYRWVSRQRRKPNVGEDQAVRLQGLPGWQWCLPTEPERPKRVMRGT